MKNLFIYCSLAFFAAVAFMPSSSWASNELPPSEVQLDLKNSPMSAIQEVKFFSDLNLTQLILKNGMTVWLKPTTFETNEVFIKLSALGGFASLNSNQRVSGQLAAQIAWESGMGEMTTDQVYVLLYEHSLEFMTKIQAFSRSIEGSSGKDDLDAFLKCVNMVFTQQKFTENGLKAAVANSKRIISKIDFDYELSYETAFLQVNTQGLEALRPLTVQEVEGVDFNTAKGFFEHCYSDPASFVCVIVGSFDLDNVQSLVNQHLGSIPKKNPMGFFDRKIVTSFPKGVTQKVITLNGRTDCVTHLTFPLQPVLDEKNIPSMEFMCQIIEARLRYIITEEKKISHGVDVSYEFPLYPFLDSPWISVRFRSDLKNVNSIKELILAELKHLQASGATEKEVQEIKRLQTGSEEFWLRDNFYWVSVLSNYYLWKWNPEQIYKAEIQTQNLTLDQINTMLKSYFTLSNYSVITGIPPIK